MTDNVVNLFKKKEEEDKLLTWEERCDNVELSFEEEMAANKERKRRQAEQRKKDNARTLRQYKLKL